MFVCVLVMVRPLRRLWNSLSLHAEDGASSRYRFGAVMMSQSS